MPIVPVIELSRSTEHDLEQACHHHDLALNLQAQGRYRQALAQGRQALILMERAVGPDHPDVANILNLVAELSATQDAYTCAEALAKRSVAIMSQFEADGADLDRIRVQAYGTLGTLYRMQGRYQEAEPLFQQAIALAEDAFGPDDLEVSSTLNNLAILYKYTGHFVQAQSLYRRALRITVAHLGPDHPEVASIYHNLGGLEHARGRYRRAEPLARQAVAMREQALGPDHPAVAADIAALAAILDGQGKFDASVPLYHRALSIFEATFGPDHYEIAVNLNNLAVIAFEQGDVAQAEHLYEPSRSKNTCWGQITWMWP
jgi:tetratricopeptide (TPR) repeat protein